MNNKLSSKDADEINRDIIKDIIIQILDCNEKIRGLLEDLKVQCKENTEEFSKIIKGIQDYLEAESLYDSQKICNELDIEGFNNLIRGNIHDLNNGTIVLRRLCNEHMLQQDELLRHVSYLKRSYIKNKGIDQC